MRQILSIVVSIAFLATSAIGQTNSFSPEVGNSGANLHASDLNQAIALAETLVPSGLDATQKQIYVDGLVSYIYGYSLLAMAITERVATTVPNDMTTTGRAPINQFYTAKQPPDNTYTDVVLPSTSTLYASAFMNLQKEPLVLHIPQMPPLVPAEGTPGRFFIIELLDAWTNVSTHSPGSRLTSPAPGDYLLRGPDWDGDVPAGLAGDIKFDTNTIWAIGRFFTHGTMEDLTPLNQSLEHLTLTPLSRYGKQYKPFSHFPVNPSIDTATQPIQQVDDMDACAFFGTMSAMMMTNPPRKVDVLLHRPLKTLGLLDKNGNWTQFSCATFYPTDETALSTLQSAVAKAKDILKKVPTPSQTTTQWSMPLNVGDYGINYVLRAVVAQKALGANLPQDAVYAYTGFDGAGKELVSPNHYVIHFRAATQLHLPGEIPPVNPGGFWSITMYDGNGFLVPDSPYNALGKPFVQGHQLCLNPDKSLDVFIQPEQPSNAQQACNWLKSPQADATPNNFIMFIRLYWPDQALFRRVGGWIPPPIQSAGQ